MNEEGAALSLVWAATSLLVVVLACIVVGMSVWWTCRRLRLPAKEQRLSNG